MKEALPIPSKHTEITFELLRERLDVLRETLAKDATPAQLNLFAQTCVSLQLNPFIREIDWISGKRPGPRVSRKGLLKLVQRTGRYRGMQSGTVWPGDEFRASIDDGVPHVHHVALIPEGPRTVWPLGAWALLFMRGYKIPLYAWASWADHARDVETKSGHDSVWATSADDMMRKVPESIVLGRALGDMGLAQEWQPMTVEEIDHEAPAIAEAAAQALVTEADTVSSSRTAFEAEKNQLISEIERAEQVLAAGQWDNWHVTPRRVGSRVKHAGTLRLREAAPGLLAKYLAHLQEVVAEMRASDAGADDATQNTPDADDAAAEALFEERVHDEG